MNKVVEILMRRDEIDQETAEALVAETRDEIMCGDHLWDADDVIREYLELEPDYLFDVLNF